jgi:hypothetical protein
MEIEDRATNTDHTKLYFNAIKASALVNGQHPDRAQAIHAGWPITTTSAKSIPYPLLD